MHDVIDILFFSIAGSMRRALIVLLIAGFVALSGERHAKGTKKKKNRIITS